MPNQIVNQHGAAAHPQRFIDEMCQLSGLQVMREETATHQVESVVLEGKCERIGDHRAPLSIPEVGPHAVEVNEVQHDAAALQLPACSFRHLAKAGGNFEHGEMPLPSS